MYCVCTGHSAKVLTRANHCVQIEAKLLLQSQIITPLLLSKYGHALARPAKLERHAQNPPIGHRIAAPRVHKSRGTSQRKVLPW